MPNTNVHITIQRIQHFDGLEPERVEQTARGCLEETERGFTLTYLEGEESGLGGTRTVLEGEGSRLILTRAGELSSQMVFEAGLCHRSDYQTPYGTLPLEVHTHSLRTDLARGEIEIDYHITIGPQQSGRTSLRLSICGAGEEEGEQI